MPYWKKMIDEMTPEERFNRVVVLLRRVCACHGYAGTDASVRLLNKQRAATEGSEKTPESESQEKQRLNFTSTEVPMEPPRRGRVPFGQ